MSPYKILLLIILGICIFHPPKTTVNARSSPDNNGKRPAPPRRIPPNKVKPGGGLSLSKQACSSPQAALTALIPIENPVLTARAYPSFLFYIPDPSAAISHGEFTLFTAREETRIYAARVNIQNTPGIIKLDLPQEAQHALEPEQPYHWYFKVYCQGEDASILDVDGWIERVSNHSASIVDDAELGIWYDAIATTAQNFSENPENKILRRQWLQLLGSIESEHLADVKIQSIAPTTSELSQKNSE